MMIVLIKSMFVYVELHVRTLEHTSGNTLEIMNKTVDPKEDSVLKMHVGMNVCMNGCMNA